MLKPANNLSMIYTHPYVNPQAFWEWFGKNQEKFKYPSRLNREEYLYWDRKLHAHLQFFSLRHLFADIIVEEQSNTARMILSAHGNPKGFSEVELFIAGAPDLEGWEFVAFYPPMPAAACTRHNYPSVTTTPEEIFFSPLQLALVNNLYNLELYVDEKVTISWEVKGAATQMMYMLLGEKTGGLYIRKVSVSYLGEVLPQVRPTLLPMTKLPEYIQLDDRSGLVVKS